MSSRGGVRLHTAPAILPVTAPAIADGALAVRNGLIDAVGAREELVAAYPEAPVTAWPGVLIPGLVNAHAHFQYSAFADLAADSTDFATWIAALTARRRDFDDTAWRDSAHTGIKQALASGTTCVADVITDLPALQPLLDSGLRGVAFFEVVGVDGPRWPEARDRLATAQTESERIRLGISPHSLYTVATEPWRECIALARGTGRRLHTHLAETVAEDALVRSGAGPFADWSRRLGLAIDLVEAPTGRSPVRHLATIGGLGPDVHVAHGVHVDADDRTLLRDHDTAVAICYRSNHLLGAGSPPLTEYLKEGNRIAIGTDSLASAPDLDLLAEIRAVRGLVDTPDVDHSLLFAATRGGALALGRPELGHLRKGARADFVVLNVDPDPDPYAAVVQEGAGRCIATVIDGDIVHEAGCA